MRRRSPAEPHWGFADGLHVGLHPLREVVVRVWLRADRAREVPLAASLRDGAAPLESCVLTATMGNFARLPVDVGRDALRPPTSREGRSLCASWHQIGENGTGTAWMTSGGPT